MTASEVGSLGDGIDHGTKRGYDQHRRREIRACDACKAAETKYKTERKLKLALRRSALVSARTVPGVRYAELLDGRTQRRDAEWDLYQAMMNSPDGWQQLYWDYEAR